MFNINITSDIDAAIADVGDFFRSQVPFAVSVALNNSAFDVRNEVVGVTWSKAFTVRNKSIARRLFVVKKKAKKRDLVATVGQDLDRDFVERQAQGGVKQGHTGGRVAVPTTPDDMRAPTGRIRASQKPRALEKHPKVFSVSKGNRTFVLKRGRKKGDDNELLYTIVPSAKIAKRFMFYDDALSKTVRVFPDHFTTAFGKAVATSRFKTK